MEIDFRENSVTLSLLSNVVLNFLVVALMLPRLMNFRTSSMASLLSILLYASIAVSVFAEQQDMKDLNHDFIQKSKIFNKLPHPKSTKYTADWKSLDSRPLPEWYTDAKFGIFLHWSVFSVTEAGTARFEWNYVRGNQTMKEYMAENYRPGFTYTDLCSQFTAHRFNASAWIEMFENAGARYIVPTSKHLEGFCNWDTKHSYRWNSMDCGPKRDLIGELADATKMSGKMKFGVYHGMMDVLDPIFNDDLQNKHKTNKFVVQKTTPQLHELISKYKPELIWSDADYFAPDTYWNSTNFLAWLYNDSPVKDTVVVNDRWGKGTKCKHGGYLTCKDGFNPLVLQKRYYESAVTSSYSGWAYKKVDNIDMLMTPTDAITHLAQVPSTFQFIY